ncbi:uncharacterized protein LOC131314527 [Rhododendron vialii]|uniref:uncharacterized protein LOC131314527 n=1 Tax=Rhododendron vialii TaxID=182163 RepID=UPI00265FBB66|nr:uncharacterized protein LOC131314527 [Rhododendron vialii]XP_058199210.1 uncharacterized protein LOC131314527 [Rhododendron vialii]XP_058199212.1 uncharacterized protein LOC131314527 [Rhododendron vialii]XP_058199213.1 uncharacterized protein LOC131314527 [Rhododendron vialii]XP_058199214.1 uncharacterized protein LOC131314527 [Rhododendron vialii]
MSSQFNNHVRMFKELPEDDQLRLIDEASKAVGDQLVINKIKKQYPTDSDKEFRVKKYPELLKNLPKDSQQNFITNAEKELTGDRIFKTKTKDPRPPPPPPAGAEGSTTTGAGGSGSTTTGAGGSTTTGTGGYVATSGVGRSTTGARR